MFASADGDKEIRSGEAFNTFTFHHRAIYNNNGNIQWRWGRGMCQRSWRSEGVVLAGLLVTVTSDDDDRGGGEGEEGASHDQILLSGVYNYGVSRADPAWGLCCFAFCQILLFFSCSVHYILSRIWCSADSLPLIFDCKCLIEFVCLGPS